MLRLLLLIWVDNQNLTVLTVFTLLRTHKVSDWGSSLYTAFVAFDIQLYSLDINCVFPSVPGFEKQQIWWEDAQDLGSGYNSEVHLS